MARQGLGTINGIFIPSMTVTFGVVLFLRLTIISSHVGIMSMFAVIALSLLIMIITSLSVTSLATNLDMGVGGIYYLITRTLGIEVGGAIGFAIYLSQLITISLAITAFAFLLNHQIPQVPVFAIESLTLLTLVLLAGASSAWLVSTQAATFLIVVAAIASVFFGAPEQLSASRDLTAYYPGGIMSFWQAFALFYPALTGIEAGMALSANLKNPARAFLFGNLSSLLLAALVYGGLAYFAHQHISLAVLRADPFALVKFAYSGKLVILGIYAATLASALGNLLSAPRVLQSLAQDGILPKVIARGSGAQRQPRLALLVSSVLAFTVLATTSLDQILPILTMICLITYGLINFIAAISELMQAPSWRPTFRVHWSLSIFGALLSGTLMLFISTAWTIAGLVLILLLFLLVQKQHLPTGFKDLRESVAFFFSRLTLYRLATPTKNPLTWHPQVLLLNKNPTTHLKLAHLAHCITSRSGILTLSSVVPQDGWATPPQLTEARLALAHVFKREKISCLIQVQPAPSLMEGYANLINTYGIGPVQPNTILLALDDENINDDALRKVIRACYASGKNLIFIRDAATNKSTPRSAGEKKRIDLWWDKKSSRSFDVAISLLIALQDSREWSEAELNLNCIAPNPHALTSLQAHLRDYLARSRLALNVSVFLEENSRNYYPFLHKYSTEASLCCIAFAPLNTDDDIDAYLARLRLLYQQSSELGTCFFISCYDHLEHRKIYHHPPETE